jgi:hypothetical protein
MSSTPVRKQARPMPASGAKIVTLPASRCYTGSMNRYLGLLIGVATLAIIGVFHPIVIKFEYFLGKKFWPLFLLLGLVCLAGSVLVANQTVSALLGILGFTFFWSIKELFEQEKRVQEGRFPRRSR